MRLNNQILHRNLKELLKNVNVIIFGAGNRGIECLHYLNALEIEVERFFDNNANKIGSFIEQYEVNVPEYKDNSVVIITVNNHYREIETQLQSLGYSEKNIIALEHVYFSFLEMKLDDKKLNNNAKTLLPTTLQFPITYKCNFDCIMCGMRSLSHQFHLSPEKYETILKNKLFTEITAVGVNGGEPFLRPDLFECISVMINTLPKLQNIYFITNGFCTDKILNDLKKIKYVANNRNIKIHVAISIDGIDGMQDFHRGHEKAFDNAQLTLEQIQTHMDAYVDSLNAICTITRHNIFEINELVAWALEKKLDVQYNIATENVRINNQNKVKDFSVFRDEHARMLTQEFFYSEYLRTHNYKYYSLYLYVKEGRRYAECPHQTNEWVTLTPDGHICFCATRSHDLGSALEYSAYDLINNNMIHLKEIKEKYCKTCSHYAYELNYEGLKELYKAEVDEKITDWE